MNINSDIAENKEVTCVFSSSSSSPDDLELFSNEHVARTTLAHCYSSLAESNPNHLADQQNV